MVTVESKNPYNPRVSVITVLYNAAKTVERTIKSVISQSYGNMEYIVIDGNSNDGSLEIIEKYRNGINIFISEPDNGIYDAMNKGISRATGEWICFMNSNDYFFNDNVVADIISKADSSDIIYGYCIDPEENRIIKPLSLNKFWKRIPMNHQSVFVKTKLHKERPFDLKYRISSVYDFFYFYYCNGVNFKYVDIPVAFYNMKGVSFYSYYWLWDFLRISMKYSKGKRMRVFLRFIYMIMVRVYLNLFRK